MIHNLVRISFPFFILYLIWRGWPNKSFVLILAVSNSLLLFNLPYRHIARTSPELFSIVTSSASLSVWYWLSFPNKSFRCIRYAISTSMRMSAHLSVLSFVLFLLSFQSRVGWCLRRMWNGVWEENLKKQKHLCCCNKQLICLWNVFTL